MIHNEPLKRLKVDLTNMRNCYQGYLPNRIWVAMESTSTTKVCDLMRKIVKMLNIPNASILLYCQDYYLMPEEILAVIPDAAVVKVYDASTPPETMVCQMAGPEPLPAPPPETTSVFVQQPSTQTSFVTPSQTSTITKETLYLKPPTVASKEGGSKVTEDVGGSGTQDLPETCSDYMRENLKVSLEPCTTPLSTKKDRRSSTGRYSSASRCYPSTDAEFDRSRPC